MITSDIGFWVDNYVGTYQIIESEGKKYIASKEFHPARNGEAELKKKRLFMDLFKNKLQSWIISNLIVVIRNSSGIVGTGRPFARDATTEKL